MRWTRIDEYSEDFYQKSPAIDPVYHEHGQRLKTIRGGSFHYDPNVARSAYRRNGAHTLQDGSVGFRPARLLEL